MPEGGGRDEPLRFADILTTASAVANYLAAAEIQASHLLDAIALLRGERSMEELGRPLSPLVRRPQGGAVAPGVRELVRRWFEDVGQDAAAEIDAAQLSALEAELRGLGGA